jgi:hypothetical protein
MAMYNLTFVETGLPTGTSWSVMVNGTALSSPSGTILSQMPNGTFTFVVSQVSGYNVTPSSGRVTIDGNATVVSVQFTSNPSSGGILGIGGVTGYIVLGLVIGIAAVVAALWYIALRGGGSGDGSAVPGPEDEEGEEKVAGTKGSTTEKESSTAVHEEESEPAEAPSAEKD